MESFNARDVCAYYSASMGDPLLRNDIEVHALGEVKVRYLNVNARCMNVKEFPRDAVAKRNRVTKCLGWLSKLRSLHREAFAFNLYIHAIQHYEGCRITCAKPSQPSPTMPFRPKWVFGKRPTRRPVENDHNNNDVINNSNNDNNEGANRAGDDHLLDHEGFHMFPLKRRLPSHDSDYYTAPLERESELLFLAPCYCL